MHSLPDSSSSEELDLSHYIDVILRRRWVVLAALIVVTVSTELVTFTMRPVYQASTLIEIEKEKGGGANLNGAMVENSDDDYYETQYKLLQSETLLRKVFDELDLAHSEDFQGKNGIASLSRSIKISPVLRSRLVYVRVDSHDAKLSAAIANKVSEDFVNQNLSNQLFISKEVLQALQMKDGRSSYDSLPAVVNNPLIQTLKSEYAKLESQYAELSQRYTEKHPALIQVKSNMAALQGQIQTETERIVQSLKMELSGQLKGNNVRIIDPANVPAHPIRPRKLVNSIIGVLGGFGLGLGFAFLIEVLDQSVRTQDDIETKLGLPFLGVIPQTEINNNLIYEPMVAKELSLTSEAFRNMRTMLDFAGIGGKSKAILVTSTVQGEGKTYVASNLAVALAQLGESVLLIDGDLRRPNIHRSFQISSELGLSEYLVSGRHPEDVSPHIQTTPVAGLSILPCGQRPPNPSELLNTPRLGALVSWASEHYDRVVVDCTPMFPINDTLLWGRYITSCVFVVRFGVTRTPLIRSACQKLISGGLKPLGVVINAAKAGGLSYASYGYHYQQYYHHYNQESGVAVKS